MKNLNLKLNLRWRPDFGALRKYSMLLVPIGILAAACLVLGLTAVSGGSLTRAIESQSVAVRNQLTGMLQDTPSSQQAQLEKRYQDQHQVDADSVGRVIVGASQRELLSYKIFPKPKDTSQQIFTEYGQRYRGAIEKLVLGMNGLDAPSDTELRSAMGMSTTAVPGTWGVDMQKKEHTGMIDSLCRKRAQECAVYANPKHLAWYDYWNAFKFAGQDKAVDDCWNSQVAYWVYEDVCTTIRTLNAGSTSVFTSPVKRLVGVSFQNAVTYPTASMMTYEGVGMTAMGIADNPMYVQMETMPSAMGVEPWTGRFCNDQMDVIHFSAMVIVDARQVMPFMRELCAEKTHTFRKGFAENGQEVPLSHNNIAILQSAIGPVERGQKEHELYRYGDSPAVQVTLTCEYVFQRAGYDEIKPESIKKLISTKPDGTTMPGAAVAPPAGSGDMDATPPPAPSAPRKPARTRKTRGAGGDFE